MGRLSGFLHAPEYVDGPCGGLTVATTGLLCTPAIGTVACSSVVTHSPCRAVVSIMSDCTVGVVSGSPESSSELSSPALTRSAVVATGAAAIRVACFNGRDAQRVISEYQRGALNTPWGPNYPFQRVNPLTSYLPKWPNYAILGVRGGSDPPGRESPTTVS